MMLTRIFCVVCLGFILSHNSLAADNLDNALVKVRTSDSEFELVKTALRVAIQNQGLVISNELHLSEMLARTAKDIGFSKLVYRDAVTLSFCNAILAQRMVRVDPLNMTVCPFSVSAFSHVDNPDTVKVVYRYPKLIGGDRARVLEQQIIKMLDNIVTEALDW